MKMDLVDIKSKMNLEHKLKGGWHVPQASDAVIDQLCITELWISYRRIVSLRCKRFDWECVRTEAEYEFLEKYKRHFDWEIYPGLFIGPHQVDFFIPRLNITVEVGGGIHFYQKKVRNEMQKLEAISRELGFAQAFFWNKDVLFNFSKIIRTLSALTPLDDKNERLNLKRALWSTVAYGFDHMNMQRKANSKAVNK